mgnify:CR=1 FL=1
MIPLFHSTYSRFQALEIIKEQTYQNAVDDPNCLPFAYCRQLADSIWEFYLKQSNVQIEIELSRLTGEKPTVIDF